MKPVWTDSDRFDHDYRVVVNTSIPDEGRPIRVDDPVEILGVRADSATTGPCLSPPPTDRLKSVCTNARTMNTRFVLAAGTTRTAAIDGISAAGADPELLPHTPSADAEVLVYGAPVWATDVPVSPTGCPTPAVVTRAITELHDLPVTVVDAGLARPTAAPTVDLGAEPGGDIRDSTPVPNAHDIYVEAREYAERLPDDHLVIGETIPGGTTTALGVLTALDVTRHVSSSLPDNPLQIKRAVVDTALDGIDSSPPIDALDAVRHTGDPVLPTVAGLTAGALSRGAAVTLAGGTQLLAAAAITRSRGHDGRLTIATTPYVADDETAAFRETAAYLDLDVTVTDPGFADTDHPGMRRYALGEGKEGVGMGGVLALAVDAGIEMSSVREQAAAVYRRVLGDRVLDDTAVDR